MFYGGNEAEVDPRNAVTPQLKHSLTAIEVTMKLRTFVRFVCLGVAIIISITPNSEGDDENKDVNDNKVNETWLTKVLTLPTDPNYRNGCTSLDWDHAPDPFCEMECNSTPNQGKRSRCNNCYCKCTSGAAVPILELTGQCDNCLPGSECKKENAKREKKKKLALMKMDVSAQDIVLLVTGGKLIEPGDQVSDSRNVYILDPVGTCKILMEDLPGKRMAHSINYLPSGEVLICGGYEHERKKIKDCLVLDPTTKRFKHHSDLLFDTIEHVGIVLNQTLWLIRNQDYVRTKKAAQKTMVKLEGNKWKVGNLLDDLVRYACVVAINDDTFISIGGISATGESLEHPVRSFNVLTNEWRNLAENPNKGRAIHICLFIPPTNDYVMGRIIVQGGSSNEVGLYIEDVTMYDVDSDTWSTIGQSIKSAGGGLFMVNHRIFRVGGHDPNLKPITTAYEFLLGNYTWTPIGSMYNETLYLVFAESVIPRSMVC